MSVARYRYFAPTSLDEAISLLQAQGKGAVLLAGGTDLLLRIRAGFIQPTAVIGLKRIAGLNRIAWDTKRGLTIGATALLSEVAEHPAIKRRYPALVDAALATANVQMRNMGTVVGNLCNASPCADNVPTLVAMGAEAVVMGSDGEKRIPLGTFHTGPGKTALEPGTLVTAIQVPPPPGGSGAAYRNISARSRVDMSAAGAGAYVEMNGGTCSDVRIVMGSVGPTPLRARRAESMLKGVKPTAALIEKTGQAAAKESKPISDVRASAYWRKQVVAALVSRALTGAFQQARKG